MSKLRVRSRFGVTPVEVLNSKTLSFKAKGLYGYIQSKPDGWSFSAERIASQSGDGRDAIRSGLKELEDYGLLKRVRYQDSKGLWQWDYVLLEQPATDEPSTDYPPVENHANISNIDIVKKNSNIEVDITEQSSEGHQLIVEVIDSFSVVNKANKTWYGRKPQRDAAKRLVDEFGLDKVLKVINLLPNSNKQQYFPTITTPVQLEQKWSQLESAFLRYKQEHNAIAEI